MSVSPTPSVCAKPQNINTSTFKHTFKTDTQYAAEPTSTDIIVLKIGSSSINSPSGHIMLANLGRFVEFAHELRLMGYKPVIVSSGAVSVGVNKLGMGERPKDGYKHATAAVGQNALMNLWSNLFSALSMTTAQILLTRDNLNSDGHYLNATNTLEQLIAMDIVPIINENDTVSISDLKIGDNDSLSAMVSCMLNAKHLFLATDVTSLYTADPKTDPTATPLHLIENINETVEKFSTPATTSSSAASAPIQSGRWGTGGIATKVTAANLCAVCGVDSSIISSSSLEDVLTILSGSYTVGTTFKAYPAPFLTGRKKFLYVAMSPVGEIYIDHQCAELFTGDLSRSYHLLSAGVLWCSDNIERGSCVNIIVADDKYLKTLFGKNTYLSVQEMERRKNRDIINKIGDDANLNGSLTDGNDDATTDDENTPSQSRSQKSDDYSNLIPNGTVIGRGIVNFDSYDILKIRGANSKNIEAILGHDIRRSNVIESDNLAIHYRTAAVTAAVSPK